MDWGLIRGGWEQLQEVVRGGGWVSTTTDTDWPHCAVGGVTKTYGGETARSLICMLNN